MILVKTEETDFERDSGSRALINTNVDAYTLYKQRRQQQNDTNNLQNQIDNIKEDIGEVKKMLMILIQRDNVNGTFNS